MCVELHVCDLSEGYVCPTITQILKERGWAKVFAFFLSRFTVISRTRFKVFWLRPLCINDISLVLAV
jgi:hypothetical protein